MIFRAKDWEFIYTKISNGVYNMMIYNPENKELFFEEYVNEAYLNGVDSYGTPYSATSMSERMFGVIFDKLSNHGYIEGFFHDNHVSEQTDDKDNNIIPAETIKKAIRGELSEEELDIVVQKAPEPADYYDFDVFISIIHKFLNGEISKSYYRDWTIVVSYALQCNTFKENSKKQLLYQAISDGFDGHSFDNLENDKETECLEMIASLKYNNHLLINVKNSVAPPFYNNKKVAVYICIDFCNHYNSHYKVCVADESHRVFKIDSIANPHYLENVNYTFVDEDEFYNLPSTYYEFYHDMSIDIHKYISECPYSDKKGNPI